MDSSRSPRFPAGWWVLFAIPLGLAAWGFLYLGSLLLRWLLGLLVGG